MEAAVLAKIEKFFGQYRLKHYSKGQVLILNGDSADYVYYLVKGRVKEYDVTYRGDEIILNVFKPPAFFPMSLAINKGQNPYIYEAETDIDIRQVPAAEAVRFIKANPDVMLDLLSRLYQGTDGLLARMSYLMAGSAKSRLMFEVLLACRRYGESKDGKSYTIALNESELGARAGLSRETVSREMRKLAKEKLLTLKAGAITVYSLTALEEKLGKVF